MSRKGIKLSGTSGRCAITFSIHTAFVKPDAVVVQVPVVLRNKIGIIVLLFSILKPGMLAKYILSYLHWPVTQILGRAGNNLWQYSHLCAIVVRQ